MAGRSRSGEVGLEVSSSQRRKCAAVRTRRGWAGKAQARHPQDYPLAGGSQDELRRSVGGVRPLEASQIGEVATSPVICEWLCSEAGVLTKFSRALSGRQVCNTVFREQGPKYSACPPSEGTGE